MLSISETDNATSMFPFGASNRKTIVSLPGAVTAENL
jgi:hypothetical protein